MKLPRHHDQQYQLAITEQAIKTAQSSIAASIDALHKVEDHFSKSLLDHLLPMVSVIDGISTRLTLENSLEIELTAARKSEIKNVKTEAINLLFAIPKEIAVIEAGPKNAENRRERDIIRYVLAGLSTDEAEKLLPQPLTLEEREAFKIKADDLRAEHQAISNFIADRPRYNTGLLTNTRLAARLPA